jgi:hypothetical protein
LAKAAPEPESGDRLLPDEDSGIVRVSASVVDAIIESTTDPLNRFYRYPAARALLPVLGRLPITPNQVTYAHIVCGLAAAALVAFTRAPIWLVIAFALCEVRMILDCFDGVLARARGTSSPFGRALDEIADSIAFITLIVAMNIRIDTGLSGKVLVCFTLGFGGLCANAWDFYKRKITTALREDRDGVVEEIREKKKLVESGKAGFLAFWGVYFDSFQVLLYDVRPKNDTAVHVIRARAGDPSFRRFAALLAFLSFDNGLFILHVGVLLGCFIQSEVFALGYAIVLWTATMVLARRVLGSVPSRRAEA